MAARNGTPINVFVGSPNDMENHRRMIELAISELNELEALPERLECKDWKKDVPPAAGRSQSVIFDHIGPFDVFVAIFGPRLGSPTGKAASGTVEEYERAYTLWRQEQRPAIIVYFQTGFRPSTREELDELGRVFEFRERLEDEVLAGAYETPSELQSFARKHLVQTIRRSKGRVEEHQAREANYLDEPVQFRAKGEEEVLLRAKGEEEVLDKGDDRGIDLLDLRLKLEAKLAWLGKHLLAGPNTPTFVTIGSLAYDECLPEDQARRAARLLAFDPGLVEGQDPAELHSFARAVAQDVANFRATVFDGFVRSSLKRARWQVKDFEQGDRHRPDFLAIKDDRTFRVAPRLVTTPKSAIKDRAVARLRKTVGKDPEARRRIVVIPAISTCPTTGPDADPQVINLENLISALEDADRAHAPG